MIRAFVTVLVLALGFQLSACSKKPEGDEPSSRRVAQEEAPGREEPKHESEAAPEPDEIAQDCVSFLRATRAVKATAENDNCPTCAMENAPEVLKFNDVKVDRISSTGRSCTVEVRIRGQFNPSAGGNIMGGLRPWITPGQIDQYRAGKVPAGDQVYKVAITYQRDGEDWRAVEFDRPE